MHEYAAELIWTRDGQDFLDNRYSRRHLLRFHGGAEGSWPSSPLSVPLPYSDAAAVDPEEMLVASLASCHMLWFLGIAARRGFRVDSYIDRPVAVMEKNERGKLYLSRATLRPEARFSGSKLPRRAEIGAMHHRAHEECFIANSVKTEVACVPVHGDDTAA